MASLGVTNERNVFGGDLDGCSVDPLTGWFRDGSCRTGPDDHGSHTICAVVSDDFLAHQRDIGNDLGTPRPEFDFPGLSPGDRWCVTAANWLRAHRDGAAAPVVLAATHPVATVAITDALGQKLAALETAHGLLHGAGGHSGAAFAGAFRPADTITFSRLV